MPYIEFDKHCNECLCTLCSKRGESSCLEDCDHCDKCDNARHHEECHYYHGIGSEE